MDSGYDTQGKVSNLSISHFGKYKLGSRLFSGTYSHYYFGKLIRCGTSLSESLDDSTGTDPVEDDLSLHIRSAEENNVTIYVPFES